MAVEAIHLFNRHMEFHEVAELFPMMTKEERAELTEDIRQNGLREPIWVHRGKIIDGRNRYLSCLELGFVPSMREWDGNGSLAAFVVSLNLHRRHLTASQKAAIAAEALPMFEREAEDRKRELGRAAALQQHHGTERVVANLPQPKSREQAGSAFGVGARYVQEAKAVKEKAPHLFDLVKSGKAKLHDSYRQVRQAVEREERANALHDKAPVGGVIEQGEDTSHIESESVHLVLTDPPYNVSGGGRVTKVGSEVVPADFDGQADWDSQDKDYYLSWLDDRVEDWARVLRPGGAVVSFIDRVMVSYLWEMLKTYGLVPKSHISWIKRNAAPNGMMRRNLSSAAEMLVWAVKPGAKYTFNEVEGWDRRNYIETGIISEREKVDHPNQKPLSVLNPLILLTTNPGDTILDPLAGSGSTGVAAYRLGRRYHLIERETDYVNLCRCRITKEEFP